MLLANSDCFKWPNIEQTIWRSDHTYRLGHVVVKAFKYKQESTNVTT